MLVLDFLQGIGPVCFPRFRRWLRNLCQLQRHAIHDLSKFYATLRFSAVLGFFLGMGLVLDLVSVVFDFINGALGSVSKKIHHVPPLEHAFAVKVFFINLGNLIKEKGLLLTVHRAE
jgi:hypothetical protein